MDIQVPGTAYWIIDQTGDVQFQGAVMAYMYLHAKQQTYSISAMFTKLW